jgi:hypothetical protein
VIPRPVIASSPDLLQSLLILLSLFRRVHFILLLQDIHPRVLIGLIRESADGEFRSLGNEDFRVLENTSEETSEYELTG